MNLKTIQHIVEQINSLYSFVLVLYALTLYFASHSQLFILLVIALTPLMAGWTGYIVKSYLDKRNLRYGFRILADTMTYEIGKNHKSTLRFDTTIKAETDHLIAYPISYQWTGEGKESVPRLSDPRQQILGIVRGNERAANPYKQTISMDGEWHYWLVAFNPPLYHGETATISYTQDFVDEKGIAKPSLFYYVRTPRKQVELRVKFPMDAIPNTVGASYIKPSDTRHAIPAKGLQFDPDKQWVTWKIDNPKKGYCYRIDWM